MDLGRKVLKGCKAGAFLKRKPRSLRHLKVLIIRNLAATPLFAGSWRDRLSLCHTKQSSSIQNPEKIKLLISRFPDFPHSPGSPQRL
jgi:hypothetical protein